MPSKKNPSPAALSAGSPVPLYHQLYVQLKGAILAGELAHGARLPGEHELCERHAVSRITCRRALAELAHEGLIERSRGRGSHVIYRPTSRPLQGSLSATLDNLVAFGRATEVALLAFAREAPEPALAARFALPEDAPLVHVVRVRSDQGQPFAWLESWTRPLGSRYSRAALAKGLRLELFRACGVTIARFDQAIGAVAAPPQVAAALLVNAGEPLLRIERSSYDDQGRLVDYLRALYRPDRFQLTMSLGRDAAGPDQETPQA
ncbi:GntR family transcriptional regulator [Massilia oculi]|uniref:GntR family transcriptional regulator n=1 Tax=Massilia hydrophila TaxID=3044279 RepID=A0ABS7YCD6_9BURK|nr:GntR family transcriptional regulator [Massilia oculi]MCA1857369.1 GntR family transcriptional regulator [Massilia oculi]